MIFEASDSDAKKVYKARQYYMSCKAKQNAQRKAIDKAYQFRHGDQWPSDVRAQLESEGRPALVFNLIAPTMRELIGANEDQRREARAAPVGAEDLPTSDALNHLWQRVYEDARVESVEYAAFDDMITGGIGYVFVDAHPSEQNPNQIEMSYDPIDPQEIVKDPNSRAINCDDCQVWFWSRWMSEADFRSHYPDHAEKYEELIEEIQDGPNSLDDVRSLREATDGAALYFDGLADTNFFNAKQKQIRVVHMEYQVAVRHYFVYDPRQNDAGVTAGYVRVKKSTYDKAKASGAAEVHSAMGKKWKWFEFTGAQALFDEDQPLPMYYSQIQACTCYYDPNKSLYYGIVRDLMDPQLEYNKRVSQELNLMNQSAQPGMIYDQGAFPGKTNREVEGTMKRPGFALERAAGKSHEFREAPPLPAAPDRMAERALSLVQLISGIDTNPLLGGQPDQVAVGTAMLSHRKGLLALTPILQNFREFQQRLLSSTVEVIMQGFNDDQIESMLGNSLNLTVQDGFIIDQEKQTRVAIRELRAVKWNIEMESAAANTTQQMMMFSLLQQLQAGGMPIDPDVFFSYFPGSREERHKLAVYFKEASAQQAKVAAEQAQIQQQSVENIVKVEAMKVQQRDADSKLRAATTESGNKLDLLADFLGLYLEAQSTGSSQGLDKMRVAVDGIRTQIEGFKVGADIAAQAQSAEVAATESAAPQAPA